MHRVLSFLVAVTFAVVGTGYLQLAFMSSQWSGTDHRALAILAGLAIYIYGVALFATWHAVRPIRHGSWILLALCTPAVLYVGYVVTYLVVARVNDELQDRRRMAEAAALWEEWRAPEESYGIPIVLDDRMLIATASGIFESTDMARSWTRVAERFGERPVERWQRIGTTLFAASFDELFRSEDLGRTWLQLGVPRLAGDVVLWTDSAGPRSAAVHALVTGGTDLYLDSYSDVFRSEDLGESWTLAYQPDRQARETRSLMASGDTLFVGTFVGGLHRSVDRGASWSRLEGVPYPLVTSLAAGPDGIYAVSHRDRAISDSVVVLQRSSDGGDTWQPVDLGSIGTPRDFAGLTGTAMVWLTDRGVFAYEAQDASWSEIPLPRHRAFAYPHAVGRFFGVASGRLFRLDPDDTLNHFGRR